jgi:uncharacterized ParB-like nuclease family protein
MIIRYSTETSAPDQLPIAVIKINGGTQSRAGVNDNVIDDYAAALLDGAVFPKVTVFYDGEIYWLADGFHRLAAHEKAGKATISADIRQGNRRDAILFSVGANSSHGLRRTNDDKRRAVSTLLADAEWSNWSDRKIAECAGVSNQFVSNMRLSVNGGQIGTVRTVERNGTVYQQNTAAIGRSPQCEETSTDHSVAVDEDEITEEDLANDLGFQKAMEALNSAKAFYDEVQAMPAAEPMTPEREAQLKRAFGTVEDRSNLMAVINATKLLDKLPEPEAVAASVPPTMAHAVNVVAVLNLSNWFEKFARAWERRKGVTA